MALPPLTHDIEALIDESAPGVWRYRPALALSSDVLVLSLGEGRTPVVDLAAWGSGHGLTQCRAKLEYMAPTGSFKDRGAAPVIASLKAEGAATIVEDSSGNAGAAMAAYAARAALAADIYVPAVAPAGKIAQIAQYGATVHRVEGTREDVAAAAAAAAQAPGAAYASHSRHPAFVEGAKTFVLELLEDGVDALPRHFVFPVGNGGLILGAHKVADGVAASRPAISDAAPAHCASRVLRAAGSGVCDRRRSAGRGGAPADHRGRDRRRRPGTRRGRPPRRPRHRRHGAGRHRRSDRGGPRSALARHEGLFVEATSAAAFAAAAQLRAQGAIADGDSVLIPATGSGLKDPPQLSP